MLGKFICWLHRKRGGRHNYKNGFCVRCEHQKRVRKAKAQQKEAA